MKLKMTPARKWGLYTLGLTVAAIVVGSPVWIALLSPESIKALFRTLWAGAIIVLPGVAIFAAINWYDLRKKEKDSARENLTDI